MPTKFTVYALASLTLLLAIVSIGCLDNGGNGDGTNTVATASSISVTPILEPSRREVATIGPSGGSLSAEGSDGVFYTLEIPEFALLEETEIAMIPVIAIPDLPFSGGLAGSVEFEPDGLQLYGAATLRIEVPGGFVPPPGTRLTGFASRSGDNFHARLAQEDGRDITVPITHFSGGGAAAGTVEEFQELVDLTGPFEELLGNDLNAAADDPEAQVIVLRDAYDLYVRPFLLDAAESDEFLERELPNFIEWFVAVSRYLQPDDLSTRVQEAVGLMAAALRAGIARTNDVCFASRVEDAIDLAIEISRLQRVAVGLFALLDRLVELQGFGLDRDAVLAVLCVQVALSEVSFPVQPLIGEPSILSVEVAVAGFDVGPNGPILVTTTPVEGLQETQPATVVLLELGPDLVDVPYTAISASQIVILDVMACIDVEGLEDVCGRDTVVRGLRILPPFTVLPPGAEQVFVAEIFGDPVTNPVWTATGGTITQDGLYTAGATTGNFEVEVTSIDFPAFVTFADVAIVLLDPTSATLAPGGQEQFTVDFGGSSGPPIWQATGGSITQDGLFTAGSEPGNFEVTASDPDDPERSASASVFVTGDFEVPPLDVNYTLTVRDQAGIVASFDQSTPINASDPSLWAGRVGPDDLFVDGDDEPFTPSSDFSVSAFSVEQWVIIPRDGSGGAVPATFRYSVSLTGNFPQSNRTTGTLSCGGGSIDLRDFAVFPGGGLPGLIDVTFEIEQRRTLFVPFSVACSLSVFNADASVVVSGFSATMEDGSARELLLFRGSEQ